MGRDRVPNPEPHVTNRLIAHIRWQDPDPIQLQVQRPRVFHGDDLTSFHDPESGVTCAALGVFTDPAPSGPDCPWLVDLYRAEGPGGLQRLDGHFLIFLHDPAEARALVVQSPLGYGLPVYHARVPGGIVLSTCLREVLLQLPSRALNQEAALDFLYYEWEIPRSSTLVQGVEKVPPDRVLEIDLARQTVELSAPRPWPSNTSELEARDLLVPSITDSMQRLHGALRRPDMTLTLTGGWDSNLLLHTLSNLDPAPTVRALTVEGGAMGDELERAARIARLYPGMEHRVIDVPPGLDHLPDLVWRYEGAVFQEGIFLRHALAREAARHGPALLMGATADPILYRNLGKHSRHRPFPHAGAPAHYIRLDYQLKMHELMLNSYGVQGLYPFLNRATARCAYALGDRNRDKAVYKEQLRELLPREVVANLHKSGSLVDTLAMHRRDSARLNRVFQGTLARQLLTPAMLGSLEREPEQHRHIMVLHLAYLHIFHELFITGEHDADFGRAGCDLELGEIL